MVVGEFKIRMVGLNLTQQADSVGFDETIIGNLTMQSHTTLRYNQMYTYELISPSIIAALYINFTDLPANTNYNPITSVELFGHGWYL